MRAVFFGEPGSNFSRLHYAVLRNHADVVLWVASRTQANDGKTHRQAFWSRRDWWERMRVRSEFELLSLREFGAPLSLLARSVGPIHYTYKNDPDLLPRLEQAQPDVIVSAGFRRILPQAVLDLPRLGAFNCHPSPLPRYAGSNPWFWILRHGEPESAVTIHRMVAEADAGHVLAQGRYRIGPTMNHQQVYNRSTVLSAGLLRACAREWREGIVTERSQDLTQRTYFAAPKEADFQIHWTEPARSIVNLVRAASPAPGAWACFHGQRFLARGAAVELRRVGDPGQIIGIEPRGIRVSAGEGVVRILHAGVDGRELPGDVLAHKFGFSVGDRLE